MEKIYWIKTINGLYVGKKSDDYYIEYHLDRASPFSDTKLNDAWEKEWRTDLQENGFINSTYIDYTSFLSSEEVKSRILTTFNNILDPQIDSVTAEELYESVANMWGRGNDFLSVNEALCILLAAKNNTILNTQVDFMRRADLSDIKNFFNLQEVQRIQTTVRKKWLPSIFFTINAKNAQKGWKKLLEKEGFRTGGKDSISVNVLKHPKVLSALSNIIGERTFEEALNQLNSYKKYLIKERNLSENSAIVRYVSRAIADMKKHSNTFLSREDIILFIKQVFESDKWKGIIERRYKMETKADKIQYLLDLLLKWYYNTDIKHILNIDSGDKNWKQQVRTFSYKKDFTNYIQAKCFENRTPEPGYVKWRNDWIAQRKGTDDNPPKVVSRHKIHAGAIYPTFWKRLAGFQSGEVFYDFVDIDFPDSLYVKGWEKLDPKQDAFIWKNWSLIYPEQVAYCLTKHNAAFPEGDYEDGFITTIELEKITHY